MYFPYLYGRQAELNALSDLVETLGSPQQIFPILEPVGPSGKLITALNAFEAKKMAAYVIINPNLGDLADEPARSRWNADMSVMIENTAVVNPVFKEQDGTTASEIAEFAASYPRRQIGIVLTTSRILPTALETALRGSDYTVFLQPGANPSSYVSSLTSAKMVDVSDNFKPKERNKDYLGDDWLGNNHTTWKGTGRAGFSDYTILPSAFQQGGGPVGAIALHITYEDGSDTRVQHFVSVTNDQKMPQSVKFKEALDDLSLQVAATPARFRRSPGLARYHSQHASGSYTNLSGSKRQQISHHIYTIAKHLGI